MLPLSYLYPILSEGAAGVGGQQRGDKECSFSGVAKSGRVWKKVPESDARSVHFCVAATVWDLSLCADTDACDCTHLIAGPAP